MLWFPTHLLYATLALFQSYQHYKILMIITLLITVALGSYAIGNIIFLCDGDHNAMYNRVDNLGGAVRIIFWLISVLMLCGFIFMIYISVSLTNSSGRYAGIILVYSWMYFAYTFVFLYLQVLYFYKVVNEFKDIYFPKTAILIPLIQP